VAAEQKENAAILFKAIERLPENQRIAFTLHKLELLSYQEVAAVMETTVSAVESLLHRSKNNLKKELELYYKNVLL
jgi:RNA polymerase sigma factor (sigma-70 family)